MSVVRGVECCREVGVGFRAACYSIEQDAIPKKAPGREMFGVGLGGKPKRLVNFMPILRIHFLKKIDRPRDNCLARQIKSARANQDMRAIETICGTHSARQLDRLAGG